eukprot:scaffold19498_cov56-Isochrysis_galbana.AAC.1
MPWREFEAGNDPNVTWGGRRVRERWRGERAAARDWYVRMPLVRDTPRSSQNRAQALRRAPIAFGWGRAGPGHHPSLLHMEAQGLVSDGARCLV